MCRCLKTIGQLTQFMTESGGPTLEEVHAMVRQLESTAHEAHEHLHEEIRAHDAEIADAQARIAELEEDLADAREELRRMHQELIRVADGHDEGDGHTD